MPCLCPEACSTLCQPAGLVHVLDIQDACLIACHAKSPRTHTVTLRVMKLLRCGGTPLPSSQNTQGLSQPVLQEGSWGCASPQ